MKLQLLVFTTGALLGHTSTQDASHPVWVPQAPPFGAIAALAGIPDLPSLQPMAGPLVADVRIAEWNPMGVRPLRFLRVTEAAGQMNAAVYIWWFGHLGPYEPPDSREKRCTTAREGPAVCVLPVATEVADQHRQTLLRKALQAAPCEAERASDAYELRIQAFERTKGYPRYRASAVCEPFASEIRTFFDRVAPNDFRER